MAAELAVGLVGCGRLAQVGYAPALRRAAGVRLVAVADPDARRRETVAVDVPAYADAASLLEAATVDALVLATPANLHLGDARRAAAREVPVLVEKPPAPDAAGARALAGLHPRPHVGLNRRFQPGMARVRSAIGRARPARVDLALRLRYRRGGWGAHTVADDALLDLGPHAVDLARHLSGEEVTAMRAARVAPARCELELALGDAGRARISLATDRPHRERVVVRRREGRRALARHRSGGPLAGARALAGARLGAGAEHPLVASLAAQLEAFGRALRGEPSAPLATAVDGVAVMEAIDAARASAHGGGGWTAVGGQRYRD